MVMEKSVLELRDKQLIGNKFLTTKIRGALMTMANDEWDEELRSREVLHELYYSSTNARIAIGGGGSSRGCVGVLH